MKRVLSIFIVIASVANVVLPQAWASWVDPRNFQGPQGSEVCALQAMPEEMNVYDANTRRLKFGPQQLEYLRLNRDNLRTTYQRQLQAAIGADHYVYRELLGLFSDKHVLAYGGPGGAKTAGSNLLYIPTQAGNALTLDPSVYKVQMNPFATDLMVKGRYDEATQALINGNTMIQFERVLVDEVDKMPPQVGPAFNDLLNERVALYGPMQVRANTRHVLFTSNQTSYGLMNAWRTMDPGNGEQ